MMSENLVTHEFISKTQTRFIVLTKERTLINLLREVHLLPSTRRYIELQCRCVTQQLTNASKTLKLLILVGHRLILF